MAQGEAKSSFHYNNCLVNAAMIDVEGIMSMIKVSRNISSFKHITHSINRFLAIVFFATKIHWALHPSGRSTIGGIRNMGGEGGWERGK